jgi:hypothetical protein
MAARGSASGGSPGAPRLAATVESATERAVVTHLFPAEDYGLLRTEDGRELPFHRGGVEGDFDRLALGAVVTCREDPTESGPEAIGVTPID